MFGFDDGDEVYPVFEENIHLFDEILPGAGRHAQNETEVELLEEVLLLEAGTVNRVGRHVFD